MLPRYCITVRWSDDDDCWIADIPDLQTCSAHGDTPDEALMEVQIAMQGWLEVARDHHFPIPEPSYRPAIYANRLT